VTVSSWRLPTRTPNKQFVLAFDRKTGKALWTTLAHEAAFTRKNPKNSHASATPACDGQRLYSVFLNADGLPVTAVQVPGAGQRR
jgi:outer membrane protein assembly factor BamB